MYVYIYVSMFVLYRHAAAASSAHWEQQLRRFTCFSEYKSTNTDESVLFFFLVRPGSVIGMQQHYLVQWEHQLRRCDGALLDPQVV